MRDHMLFLYHTNRDNIKDLGNLDEGVILEELSDEDTVCAGIKIYNIDAQDIKGKLKLNKVFQIAPYTYYLHNKTYVEKQMTETLIMLKEKTGADWYLANHEVYLNNEFDERERFEKYIANYK